VSSTLTGWLAAKFDSQFYLSFPFHEYQVRNGAKYFQPEVALNYLPSLSPMLGHAWVLKWRYFDSPFPISKLVDQVAPPKLPFGPILINFGKLQEFAKSYPLLVRDLQTAELLIPGKIRNPRADIGLFPMRHQAFVDHGDRFLALQDFPRAYEAYRRAYNLDDNDPMILTRFGFACLQVGKFEEGNGHFEKYLSTVPADLNARLFYAQALEATRQYRKALEQYQRVKELQPNHPQIAQIDQRIAALQQGSRTGR
jgi:tetratricopeptide (TPR) repeat protein